MPYIPESRRQAIQMTNDTLDMYEVTTCGELNFAITILILSYWRGSAKNYQAINDIVGSLGCAKQEFYRKIAIDYENKKCNETGEIYGGISES